MLSLVGKGLARVAAYRKHETVFPIEKKKSVTNELMEEIDI